LSDFLQTGKNTKNQKFSDVKNAKKVPISDVKKGV
jgi:hypothetical protein